VDEGEAGQVLYRVRSAVRLSDGRYAIGNAGTSEVRFFDHEGRFLFATGGRGAGPGEFGEFSSLRICVSSGQLIVEDNGQDRVHIFQEDGEFVETIVIEPVNGRPPNIVGCFADGSLLAVSGGGTLQGNAGDVLPASTVYHLYSQRGEFVDTIVGLGGQTKYVDVVGESRHYPVIPFTPDAELAASADAVYVSDDGRAVVRKHDLSGAPLLEIHWNPGERTRVRDVWDEYTQESLGHMGERDLRMYRHFYAQDLPLPEFVPVVAGLKVDLEGNVWVEHARPLSSAPNSWTVISSEGVLLGRLELPRELEVIEIGSDYIIGRTIDELAVERIQVHRIQKATDSP
jgi:hypothetical protein